MLKLFKILSNFSVVFDLYREQILDRSQNPRFQGSIENATHFADGENRSCGDEVHIEVIITDGSFSKICHTTRACAVCSATTDLLAEEFEGKPVASLHTFGVEQVTELLGIPLSPIRLKCALLPLETLKNLILSSKNKL